MSSLIGTTTRGAEASNRYWRSLDDLADTPEFRRFVAAEFPSLWDRFSTGPDGSTRRQFLKVMGASFALAGLAGCRWPKENIVPATKQPGDRIPGVPVQYATAMELGGVATGLLVTSYDGRPIKIEGNEKHPFSRGKTNALMQASVLELYDPDRSAWPVRGASAPGRRQNSTWEEFEAFARVHFAEVRARGGAGLAVLSEASSAPSLRDVQARFQAVFPQAQWYEYEPLSRDNEIEGARLAFGRPYRAHLNLAQADVIVSLDSDFLMTHPAAVKHAGDFAARRRADDGSMNRLYVFESGLTVTGSNADRRWALRSADIPRLAYTLFNEIELASLSSKMWFPGLLPGLPVPATELKAVAADVAAHRGRCVIVVGSQQPAEVHRLAHFINDRLGNVGATVRYTEEPDGERPTHVRAIETLTRGLQDGSVDTLVILGGNPVYDAPADLGFAAALAKVKTAIHLSLYDNETSQACLWHLPRAHFLEAWGDALAYDGTLSIIQPLIAPLYDGRTAVELLALLTQDRLSAGHDIVRRTFGNAYDFGVDREKLWSHALEDGLVAGSAWPTVAPALDHERTRTWLETVTVESAAPAPAQWELVFRPDNKLYDGRFANNAWLQELPDPITKLTWDNAALLSPVDAERIGVQKNGDVVRIELAGRSIEMPVYIMPGHAAGALTLPLGYGRGPAGGKVADGTGFDTYKLRTTAALHAAPDARVTATGKHYALATTQDHHAIDSQVGREETQKRIGVLVREATLQEYRDHPRFAEHVVHLPQLGPLWQEKQYTGHKWGMAIDLSACIGCGVCVAACQAENNVPVVGKDEVARGREMHWIRVDRYFKTEARSHEAPSPESGVPSPADIQVVHQPVTCVHCENAPCEQVCPVAATVHDSEGLNVQVYNRCVGTRYCSNNCPFKVRRFNWFYNHHGPYHPRSRNSQAFHLPGKLPRTDLTDMEKMVNNPNVTVRSRGVMEKCTFCVQRINAVKIKAQNERWDSIPDGLITPACAQACPTDAIVFGDLNDPHSRVRKLHEHNRAYFMLAELDIRPRTAYLAKLRNPLTGNREQGAGNRGQA